MAKRFCICGAITTNRTACDQCEPNAWGTTTARGYGSDWQRKRERILDADPCCVDCDKAGIVRVATEVHHIVPIEQAWSLRLEDSNLAPLCEECHKSRHNHARAERGVRF